MVVAGQEAGQARLGIDTTKPHPARMYVYFLGGKNNFAVDRETAEQALKSWGTARTAARENRACLGRAVRYLVASHVTDEHSPHTLAGAGRAYQERGLAGQIRTSDEFADLAFRGLEVVDPGVVLVSDWRPQGAGPRPLASEVNAYGGVARKP